MSMCSPKDGAIFFGGGCGGRLAGLRRGLRLAALCLLQTLHYYRCVLYMYVYSIMTAGNTF